MKILGLDSSGLVASVAVVEDDVLLPQGRQYFLFVDADTLFQLAGYLFANLL